MSNKDLDKDLNEMIAKVRPHVAMRCATLSCGATMQVAHLKYKHKCRLRKDPKTLADKRYEQAVVDFARRVLR